MATKTARKKSTAPADDDLLATKGELDLKNLERHDLCAKYGPPISNEEMLALATDIESHGQHDAIKLYEGKVLAGWSRYQACRQKNITPRVEHYTGDQPEAVAFGTNAMRRRLSSITKAFMAAQFHIAVAGSKQLDTAKQFGVSLNRVNQCVQLLKLDTEEAKRVQEVLRTNPEVTASSFDEMLLECGIARSEPRQTTRNKPDGDEPMGDMVDEEDDLLGGAIEGLLDDEPDDDDDEDAPNKPSKPSTGKSSGTPSVTRASETTTSKIGRAFSGLPPAEQVKFISFVWRKLRPALDTAILAGLPYTLPAPPAPKKAKGSAFKKQVAATTPPKTKKAQPPALAAAAKKKAAAAKKS